MINWNWFGRTLLAIGVTCEVAILAAMLYMLSDMGFHAGAAIVVILVGLLALDQVHDYGEDDIEG